MKASIYTIPIHEVFEPKCGCPICKIHDMLEQRCIDYIMGAAMMEPDVRIETNKLGFCSEHLKIMSIKNNKLSLALMLETHLAELDTKHVASKQSPKKKGSTQTPVNTCFVCNEIDNALEKLVGNAIKLYNEDVDFRKLFNEQEYFCYPHYELMCEIAVNNFNKKLVSIFVDDLTSITKKHLQKLISDVHSFTTMFDYRNSSKEKDESTINSIDNAIAFLTASEGK